MRGKILMAAFLFIDIYLLGTRQSLSMGMLMRPYLARFCLLFFICLHCYFGIVLYWFLPFMLISTQTHFSNGHFTYMFLLWFYLFFLCLCVYICVGGNYKLPRGKEKKGEESGEVTGTRWQLRGLENGHFSTKPKSRLKTTGVCVSSIRAQRAKEHPKRSSYEEMASKLLKEKE